MAINESELADRLSPYILNRISSALGASQLGLSGGAGGGIGPVAAGAGLTYSSGVLNVGQGAGITINADDVALAASVAGDGLSYSAGVLNVGAGAGLSAAADFIALGTPSSLSVTSANSASGTTHTHQVIYTTSGAANTLVATDANGNIVASGNFYAGNTTGTSAIATPMRLDGASDDLYLVNAVNDVAGRGRIHLRTRGETVEHYTFDGPTLTIREGASNFATLGVNSLGNLAIAPSGPLATLPATVRLQSTNYASQTTGWGIDGPTGGADFRYLFADEMHVRSFVADLEQALAGGQIIAKSVAVLAEAFTAPAASSGGALAFRGATGNAGTTNSLNVTAISGIQDNDQMLLLVGWWNQTLTMPGGWTQLGTTRTWTDGNGTHNVRLYRRTASSEPGSYTFTLSASDDIEVAIGAWSGVDTTTPIDATISERTNSTASTSMLADQVTTATNGAWIVFAGAALDNGAGGDSITAPGGMTSRRNATNGTWVRMLLADEARATAGATGSRTATLDNAEANATFLVALRPAPTNTATLRVRDLPSAANMAVFESGDVIRLRQFTRASGSLSVADCWGVVTSYADGSGANEGTQTWTFTRSAAPNSGAMSAGTVIQLDAIVLDYGVTGNGFYEVNAIDGAYGINSPYAQVVTWSGHPATGRVVRGRYGNLRGIFGAGDEYGLYAGAGVTDADQYLRISNLGVRLNNVPLQLFNSGSQTVNFSSTGTNVWIGVSTSDRRLNWDGTTLTVTGAINVTGGNAATLSNIYGAENLAFNSSFEVDSNSDGLADGFTVYNNDGGSVPTAASRVSGYRSVNAQRISWTGTNLTTKGVYFSTGQRRAGQSYILSFWARTSTSVALGSYYNDGPSVLTQLQWPTASTTWQFYAARFVWSSASTDNWFLSILSGSAIANGWIEFDNISVTEGDSIVPWAASSADQVNYGGQVRMPLAPPAAAGLYLSSTYMGYHDGSSWRTYMDSAGQFVFRGSAARVEWNGSQLSGYNATTGGTVQWQTDATTGEIVAAAGAWRLGAAGLRIDRGNNTERSIRWMVSGGNEVSRIWSQAVDVVNYLYLSADDSNGSSVDVVAVTNSRFAAENGLTVGGGVGATGGNIIAGGSVTAAAWTPAYSGWNALGVGDGGSAIYNDNGAYQALMVVGNTSAGGNRRVQVYDELYITNQFFLSTSRIGEAWSSLSYNTGWDTISGYNAAQYKRVGDLVFVRGTVQRTSGSATVIATLPSGYRPVNRTILGTVGGGDAVARVDIRTNGDIDVIAGSTTYIALDGIVFSLL